MDFAYIHTDSESKTLERSNRKECVRPHRSWAPKKRRYEGPLLRLDSIPRLYIEVKGRKPRTEQPTDLESDDVAGPVLDPPGFAIKRFARDRGLR